MIGAIAGGIKAVSSIAGAVKGGGGKKAKKAKAQGQQQENPQLAELIKKLVEELQKKGQGGPQQMASGQSTAEGAQQLGGLNLLS